MVQAHVAFSWVQTPVGCGHFASFGADLTGSSVREGKFTGKRACSARFHDLRHTAATLLLGRGINPKIVSEMLGHSQIGITLGLYSHVTPHMQQQAADAMDAALDSYRESSKRSSHLPEDDRSTGS